MGPCWPGCSPRPYAAGASEKELGEAAPSASHSGPTASPTTMSNTAIFDQEEARCGGPGAHAEPSVAMVDADEDVRGSSTTCAACSTIVPSGLSWIDDPSSGPVGGLAHTRHRRFRAQGPCVARNHRHRSFRRDRHPRYAPSAGDDHPESISRAEPTSELAVLGGGMLRRCHRSLGVCHDLCRRSVSVVASRRDWFWTRTIVPSRFRARVAAARLSMS